MLAMLPALLTALASEFIDNGTVLKWVGFAGEIVNKGVNVDARLGELTDQIKQMVTEKRDPTPDEWKSLQERSDIAHATIQDWKPSA